MRKRQRVADMADEVLARQAVTRAIRTGERFKTAFEAEAAARLGKLRSGPHRDERAQKRQRRRGRGV